MEVHARKSLQINKGDSRESPERTRESYTETFHFFREYLSILNRMCVEIRTVIAFLMRSQTEMKNMLSETRGKVILIIKWLKLDWIVFLF